MKIISWNVNGIRARIKQGFNGAIKQINPDIICIQEFRARENQLPKDFLSNYQHYHSIHEKAGYAGSSVFIKKELIQPATVKNDYDGGCETGRVCILEFENFYLISSYSPNSGGKLEKLDRRIEWENGLTKYIDSLNKPVILCGDLNVAPERIDAGVWCLAGCSPEERLAFRDKKNLEMTDVFRWLNPNKVEYTWFSNRDKEKKNGLRLDEFLISDNLKENVKSFKHIYDTDLICGSDHVPILMEVDI